MTADEIEMILAHHQCEGVISPEDVSDYFDVITDAFGVHIDRERIRHGLWKDYPAEDQGNQIKVKIDRVLRSLERLKFIPENTPEQRLEREALKQNAVSEGHDIINYANFLIRILEGKVS